MFEHEKDGPIVDFVKCFLKFHFENENLFLRLVAHMDVLKRPCKTILNIPGFDETILILAYHRNDAFLDFVCKQLSKDFDRHTYQGDGPEVIGSLWVFFLRD